MSSVQQNFLTALQNHQAGRLRQAEELYRSVLRVAPNHIEALHLLGVCAHQLGRPVEAEKLIRQAIRLDGSVPAFFTNLAAVMGSMGQYEEAVIAARKAVELRPRSADSQMALGCALLDVDRYEEAGDCFKRASELDPVNAKAHHLLGRSMISDPQRLPEVLQALQHAVRLDPKATVYNDLGFALARAQRMSDSLEAFKHALELEPNHAGALNNMSTTLKALGRLDEAVAACEKALQINPQLAEAACNLGVALTDRADFVQAEAAFHRALELKPDYATAHSRLLFSLQYQPGITPSRLLQAHRDYQRRHVSQGFKTSYHNRMQRDEGRPLSVGFISDGFGAHPVGHFLVRLLHDLDRTQLRVVCYSDRIRSDLLNRRIRALADEWHETAALNNQQLAQQIAVGGIDVLFDLSGHVGGRRMLLFARRAAPLQLTWMGYVGTTGLSNMDYIIADQHHIPAADESYYTERVLRLPHGYVCYEPPPYAPDVALLPALTNRHVTFGSFNQPAKTNWQMVEVWSRVLKAVPDSRLLLKYRGFADSGLQRRYQHAFTKYGIAAERVLFEGKSPHEELLSAYNRIDIGLDTQPYSGGLTTCEALWMGVPVITRPGVTFAGRHSLSHLQTVGLTETIATNWDAYVDRAKTLASDLPRLAQTRRDLRSRMAASPLCDGARFARDWSQLIHDTWQRTVGN